MNQLDPMRIVILCAACGFALWAVAVVVVALRRQRDDRIDDLITMNKHHPCSGMAQADIHLINRIGKRNAEDAFASVERTRIAERLTRRLQEQRTKVLKFKSQTQASARKAMKPCGSVVGSSGSS